MTTLPCRYEACGLQTHSTDEYACDFCPAHCLDSDWSSQLFGLVAGYPNDVLVEQYHGLIEISEGGESE